jgi:hypothetical protein
MLRLSFLGLALLFFTGIQAQVNGGDQMLSFLLVAQGPHAGALGGEVAVNTSSDIMMSRANPALLRPEFHQELSVNYNFYYAGTRLSHVTYGFHHEKLKTTFALGLSYLNYGQLTQTDNIGIEQGTFSAADYMMSITASRSYLTRWRYGMALKYAHSRLPSQKASALLSDLGIVYADTQKAWYVGATVKNVGVVLKQYNTNAPAPLPFDIQIGVMKKFKKAPFAFSVTAHHLYKWDIRYNNPADVVNNTLLFGDTTTKTKTYFGDKLFRHLVFALDMRLGKRLELSAGYNHLRRSELAITERKGMSGFALGFGMYLNKMNLHVAQSYYHVAGPYTEIGITLNLNQWFGLGNMGNKINWSSQFAKQYQ